MMSCRKRQKNTLNVLHNNKGNAFNLDLGKACKVLECSKIAVHLSEMNMDVLTNLSDHLMIQKQEEDVMFIVPVTDALLAESQKEADVSTMNPIQEADINQGQFVTEEQVVLTQSVVPAMVLTDISVSLIMDHMDLSEE